MKSLLLVIILFCTSAVYSQDSGSPNTFFWNSLKTLCGKAYGGTAVAAPAGDKTFEGKRLSMHVLSCQPKKIKIRLAVGDDRTRTWIFYRFQDRILLKHDHRKKDGTADGATDYGGWTSNTGSKTLQIFPADQETVRNIPAAASNIWSVNLIRGSNFTYNLRRIGTDRYFSLKFDLKKTVPFILEK